MFIVSSYKTPSPDTLLIDRLTAVCVYNNIEPIIIFNKCDMGDFSEIASIYRNSGFKTYVVSAQKQIGIDNLKEEFKEGISAFAGNSGVGKSSIINAVFGDYFLKTGEVSEKLGRGRHTTRHTEIYRHNLGGYIADTPGFSSFDAPITDYNFKLKLSDCFPEFNEYSDKCRFSTCSHTCEKGCAVIAAVNEGLIEPTRHDSYKMLYDNVKDLKEWSSNKK